MSEKDYKFPDDTTMSILYTQLALFISNFSKVKSDAVEKCVNIYKENLSKCEQEGREEEVKILLRFTDAVLKMAKELDEVLPEDDLSTILPQNKHLN